MYLVKQGLFFKYTWNNFLHLQVELCVAAILRPCAHEMRLQPDLGSQETSLLPPPQEASKEKGGLAEAQTSDLGTAQNPESSAHNTMVAHVSVSLSPSLSPSLPLTGHLLLTWLDSFILEQRGPVAYLSLSLSLSLSPSQLFQHCRLVQRILDAWEENDKIQ